MYTLLPKVLSIQNLSIIKAANTPTSLGVQADLSFRLTYITHCSVCINVFLLSDWVVHITTTTWYSLVVFLMPLRLSEAKTVCPTPFILYQGSCLTCPASYTRFENKCYKWHSGAASWQSARAVCQRDNVDLVSLNDHSFFEHVRQFANTNHSNLWVGANDLQHEGQWHWVNGAPVHAGMSGGWVKGQPDQDGDEDCGHLNPAHNWYMNDWKCTRRGLDFMCEKKVETSNRSTQNRTLVSPCLHGGRCNEYPNGYNCTCTEQYIGSNCETDLLTRHDSTCKPDGSCYAVFTMKFSWDDA